MSHLPPLRIIALPLLRLPLQPGGKLLNVIAARATNGSSTSSAETRREDDVNEDGPLIYWHVSQNSGRAMKDVPKEALSPDTPPPSSSSTSSGSSTIPTSPSELKSTLSSALTTPTTPSSSSSTPPEISLLNPSTYPPISDVPRIVTDKASGLWLSWGKTGDNLRDELVAKRASGASSTGGGIGGEDQLSMFERLTVQGQRAKYATWRFGEGMMDKIAFEEWALKTINPMGKVVDGSGSGAEGGKIPFYVPSLKYLPLPPSTTPQSLLLNHLSTRLPTHSTLLTRSLILLPFLAPIGLLPVVPNLPGLYVMWRAWSHWKARKGGEWLKAVVEDEKKVEVVESEALTRIMDGSNGGPEEKVTEKSTVTTPDSKVPEVAPDATATPTSMLHSSSSSATSTSVASSSTPRDPDVYLDVTDIPLLTKEFSLSPAEVVDITRAVVQAKERLDAYRKSQNEQKA